MNEDINIDNYKMAIIPSAEHGELQEGEFFKYGPFLLYIYHDIAFRDFCKKYYPEILDYPNIKQDSPAELYAYYLQLQGNIVIANITHSSTEEKYGKEAMIFMPEVISEKQKEGFTSLIRNMDDYSISILYHCDLIDDNLLSDNIFQAPGEKPIDLVNQYFDSKAQERKK